jgi:hypothetical protein
MAGFLADVTVVVHFAALIYAGIGGFMAWRWPRGVYVHLIWVFWAILINTMPSIPCPLTALEDFFREQQGLGPLPNGFNEYYIYDILIPRGWLPGVGVLVLVMWIVSYAGIYMRRRNRRAVPAK